MADSPTVPRQALAPGYDISRLIKGGWQLAGGHGQVARDAALADMMAFADAGITTFDCADIYTGVEELIGEFLRNWSARHGANAPAIHVHTKCVPDRDRLATITRSQLEALIDRSRQRLGVDTLDLVQFHWWDYNTPGWLEAAVHLDAMRREGKIRHLGLTNFDTPHVRSMREAGVALVSHQVQLSLLDRRALGDMAALCTAEHIGLLCYGALAGGFFHERWLGAPEPTEPFENRSLVKYKLIIDEFGGWEAFQALLRTMHAIATTHDTTIGAVAIRAVLDEAPVAGVIVGARHAAHLPATCAALALSLSAAERAALNAHLAAAPGPRGDVYTLERDPHGPHAGIMRYNLNTTR
ncbi:aldo/keto reductase [Gemmatimonas phototrophica]|uniref:Aldo/keto reductase n=1 Tax=Gemmatimonas phototrophica TaxID=1379270 RepID=A0A143BFT2_9BACT|nr:aldo/keto reductase [Gemmatimonas phototrophica]AMW03878.1 aldo/keto reductase [Gemmatimonas phototrophica]